MGPRGKHARCAEATRPRSRERRQFRDAAKRLSRRTALASGNDEAQMMGAVKAVQPIPLVARHPSKKGMDPKGPPMIEVAGYGPLQLGDGFLDRDVIRWCEVRVDGVARRDAVAVGPPKHGLGQEETLEPVPRQIEPVDRAVEARRKVVADLPQRPSSHGAVAG